jgi:LacI family transcriptional regulator
MTVDPAGTEILGRKINIAELATAAGVSTATVDRILNQRGGVRQPTIDRVILAADQLGFTLPTAMRRQAPAMRLAFVLPVANNKYLRLLADTIRQSVEELEQYNVRCQVIPIASFNPAVLAEHLMQLAETEDGIAFMALEHPLVREAVKTLSGRGIHLLTLISDLSNAPRAAFVGMDNRSAGRTAGLLLGRFVGTSMQAGNKVVMFAGSLSYRGHEEREMGFRHILNEAYPRLEIIGLREGHDDAHSNYKIAAALLEQHPDIIGIYNVGGASEGIARALVEANRQQDVVFVGHGLTAETRALLVQGTLDAVINVTPLTLMRNAVRIFNNLRDGREPTIGVEAAPIGIVLRENLP